MDIDKLPLEHPSRLGNCSLPGGSKGDLDKPFVTKSYNHQVGFDGVFRQLLVHCRKVAPTRKIDEVREVELRFFLLFLHVLRPSQGVYTLRVDITFFAMSFIACRANT